MRAGNPIPLPDPGRDRPRARRCAGRAAALALGLALAAGTAPAAEPGAGAGSDSSVEPVAYRDWQLHCEDPADEASSPCHLRQTLVMREGRQPILIVAVARPQPKSSPLLVLTAPLGVALAPGVRLAIDEEAPVALFYERCVPSGCKVRLPMEDELVAAFKRGLQAMVVLFDIHGQALEIPVSLRGFTAALEALDERVAPSVR